MNAAARIGFNQRIDEETLMFVREMQAIAPVTLDAVLSYLVRTRRLEIDKAVMADRLGYLADKGSLKADRQWQAGEYETFYTITAKGRDILDGVLPPDA